MNLFPGCTPHILLHRLPLKTVRFQVVNVIFVPCAWAINSLVSIFDSPENNLIIIS